MPLSFEDSLVRVSRWPWRARPSGPTLDLTIHARCGGGRAGRSLRSRVSLRLAPPGLRPNARPDQPCSLRSGAEAVADSSRRLARLAVPALEVATSSCLPGRCPRHLSWRRVTEIPEHLLKRSRDRRAALGLGGDDAAAPAGDAPAATPATTAAAAPAAAAAPSGPVGRKAAAAAAPPPPPKPDPPYVAAAKSRKKIPFWAMAALSLMPVWLFMYVRTVTEAPEVASGPIGVGATVFSNCASCHGAGGEGSGSGRQFTEGEVLKTFPHIEDQLRFVYFGTANYNIADIADLRQPRPRGRRARDRLARPDARVGLDGRRRARPTPRSSPSSATSATPSAAPIRTATTTRPSSPTGAPTTPRRTRPSRAARRWPTSPTPA